MEFVVDDYNLATVEDTYLGPIRAAASPYAVVWSLAGSRYRVAPAMSNEHARLIVASLVNRCYGLRVYLTFNGWCGQVHYAGGIGEGLRPWASDDDCVDLATSEWMREIGGTL